MKIIKLLNKANLIILLVSFLWVVFINTSYFFEKIIFGERELYTDLKLIHNNFIDFLANRNPFKLKLKLQSRLSLKLRGLLFVEKKLT